MNPSRSLRQIAKLTLWAQLIQQMARFIVGFILPPLILQSVGAAQYGLWLSLFQSLSWLALADLRPMPTVKLMLSVSHRVASDQQKRQILGAGFMQSLFTLPQLAAVAYAIWYFFPSMVKGQPVEMQNAREVFLIILTAWNVERFLSLPANALRGVNREYLGSFISAAIILGGGAISWLMLENGYGLTGLALAYSIERIFSVGYLWFKALRELPWLGLALPDRSLRKEFLQISVLGTITTFGVTALTTTDLIACSLLHGAAATAAYSLTGTLFRWGALLITNITGATGVGLAGLCGAGEWERVQNARLTLMSLSFLSATILAITFSAFNRVFILNWAGEGQFAGDTVTLAFSLIFVLASLARVDSLLLDCVVELGRKIAVQVAAGFTALVSILTFGFSDGLQGIALAYLLANSVYSVLLLALCERHVARALARKNSVSNPVLAFARKIVVTAVLCQTAVFFGPRTITTETFLLTVTGLGGLFVLCYQLGLGQTEKRLVRALLPVKVR